MAHDILIVDDEADIRDLVSDILQDEGYSTRTACDGLAALEAIKLRQPSLVILDVWLGDSDRDGLKILDLIKRDHPHVPVVMISGHGTIETAVTAIKKGAYDFIEKPFQTEKLLIIISRAIESSMLRRENESLKKKAGTSVALFGQNSTILQIRQSIEKTAPSNSRIFLSGPTGSEKESVARLIHDQSKRASGPFVVAACSLMHPQFAEAELFGTEIAGLNHDQPRKIGLLEHAHTGTLYLADVDELPLQIQAKLLKFLQEGFFYRVGSNEKIDVDVRVIGSSSKAEKSMADGNFREDLFYRLSVVNFKIPALKDRITDIPVLAKSLLEEQASLQGISARKFSEEALAIMQSYDWPGNIKQLKNALDWILIHSQVGSKEPITIPELPPEIIHNNSITAAWNKGAEVVVLPLREAREAFERDYLLAQVNRFGGNISQTARFIGMERSALHRKLRALGVYDEKDEEKSA